jgi:predicted secreted protein
MNTKESTTLNDRNETIKILTEHGHRIEYVCPDFVLLATPNREGTIRIVTVTNDGSIEAGTLSDVLTQLLK